MNIIGKIIRLPLKLIPRNLVIKFLFGPLKGYRWVTGASNHGYWLGIYERGIKRMLREHLKQDMVFYDLGAHVGYFTLLGSRLVGENGVVYAFEPHPLNLTYLKKHLFINGVNNVQLFEGAVSSFEGEYCLNARSRVSAKLSEKGSLKVHVYALRELIKSKKIRIPNVIKMDIEGSEYDLLRDNEFLLASHKPVLLLSTHGTLIHEKCVQLLRHHNYLLTPLDARDVESCTELLAV
jgi:FkbM family methyltransferase